jgi:TRAP transporter 4TM/12TM fusion protein
MQMARLLLGTVLLVFQLYIIINPQAPLVERPLHLVMTLALAFLWSPLQARSKFGRVTTNLIEGLILAAVAATGVYYMTSVSRLTERMEMVDSIYAVDLFFGTLVVILMLEGVRRVVGWSLLSVLLGFLAYAAAGPWLPGWLNFSGFRFDEMIEILTMSLNGILGITTETSVQFVFYFVIFGAFYAVAGGGQLFIDIGLHFSGRYQGGAGKAAVISSSLMGTISGSAVANVAATGVFTVPLMRKAGYSAENAAAIVAVASTGGQLMPPVMGVAAFLVAEILQMEYIRIAIAGVIPAVAYYVALLIMVDLTARKTGIGTLTRADIDSHAPILPRLYLLAPPVLLVMLLVMGYSATLSAVLATASCVVVSFVRRENWLTLSRLKATILDGTKQAAQVAVPIAAIGIIIAIAIQSNLALKFSTRLMGTGGGSLIGAMLLIVIGCLIMGMGLPTVAAYIIGAILFVPALIELGIAELPAHFFVMYYCVLSMITPPVALASYAAAGLAGANTMRTGTIAFRMSLVCFLIPFAFAFDPSLLAQGATLWTIVALFSTLSATAAWAVAVVGYLNYDLGPLARLLIAVASVAVILAPTATMPWLVSQVVLAVLLTAAWIYGRRVRQGAAEPGVEARPHG